MNSTSTFFMNGSTVLEVAMPPHLSGASPTTFFCGNLLWRQFAQAKNTGVKQQPKQDFDTVVSNNNVPLRAEYSQLHLSACLGQSKMANSLLENCKLSDVNKQDHNGNSPLHWAASEGREEVVQLLLDNHAAANLQNFAGETALFLAAARGFESICATLLEFGANPNLSNVEGVTPLHMAAASGSETIVQLLCSRGAFVNAQDESGDSPLHYAVREEQNEIVEMLVSRCNACVDVENDDQETPLQLASCLECTLMVQFLSKFSRRNTGLENKHEGNLGAMFSVQGNFEW